MAEDSHPLWRKKYAQATEDLRHLPYLDYVTALQGLMGLAHWRVTLTSGRNDDEQHAEASVYVPDHCDELHITLRDNFYCLGPQAQRQTIVHELLHAHTRDMSGAIGRVDDPTLLAWHLHAEETCVDRLSRAPFVDAFPLPPACIQPGLDEVP